jgi:hypothetical protein
MSANERHDVEAWKYAEKAMTWYGWGSPVGIGMLIVSVGAFVLMLHYAGVIR